MARQPAKPKPREAKPDPNWLPAEYVARIVANEGPMGLRPCPVEVCVSRLPFNVGWARGQHFANVVAMIQGR